jgi:hypothetical protein
VEQQCVACDDPGVTCEDPTPACDPGSGACVECTEGDATACTGDRPVCEDAACRACLEHEECASGACNLLTGACFTGALELWVDDDAAGGGDGSMGMPFQEIREATTGLLGGDVAIVHVAEGSYTQAVVVSADTTAIVLGPDSGMATVTANNALDVDLGAQAFVARLQLMGAAARSCRCTSATVWADDTVLRAAANLGVDATDCTVVLRRSTVDANQAGGIRAVGGTLRVENGFVTRNGGVGSTVGGLYADGAEVEVVYTTIAGNITNQAWDSMGCGGGASGSVRNAILASPSQDDSIDEVGCAAVTLTYTALDNQAVAGQGNVNYAWDENDFVSVVGGDFHVEAGGAFEDVALWVEGDPDHDVDGDARPEGMDYAGADVP